MTFDKAQKFKIDDWEVSLTACTLSKCDIEVKVTPRSMDVLNHLVENAGEVVSSDELLNQFWHGTFPSDHAVHKAIAELRSALGDDAHKPSYIRTIPKRGYSLIAQVRRDAPAETTVTAEATVIAGSTVSGVNDGELISPVNIPSDKFRISALLDKRILIGFAALVVFLSILLWPNRDVVGDRDMVVRLAVLPFVTRGLDSGNQFLTDGLRESLVNGLSKLSHMEVISPARGYEDFETTQRSERLVDRARGLRADHVLHGSVQTIEGRIRVTVQLTRATDGVHQYSEQFDLPVGDLFGLQDQIVSNVVAALAVHLNETERSQMLDWGTSNAIAYERFLRGNFYYNQFSPHDFKRAIDHYRSAIELDPSFINAYQGVATAANNLAVYSSSARIQELSSLIDDIYREVALISPGNPVLGSINEIKLRMSGVDQAQQEMQLREQILSGDPQGFAIAHYALFLIGARLYDEASQFLDKAAEVGPFEISPDEVWSYRSNIQLPRDQLLSAKRQLQERPYHIHFLGSVAANLALTGDFRQAEMYLNRQRDVDEEGILAHYSEAVIGFLSGTIQRGNAAYDAIMDRGEDFNLTKGALSFMLGDINAGTEYWRNIPPLQRRRLFNVTHGIEKYFPLAVLEDSRYEAVLEELNFGKQWQRQLMEGVMVLQDALGVKLSERARTAYDANTFMTHNDLWTEEQWQELTERKLAGMGARPVPD